MAIKFSDDVFAYLYLKVYGYNARQRGKTGQGF